MNDKDFAHQLRKLLPKPRSGYKPAISDDLLEILIANARHKLRSESKGEFNEKRKMRQGCARKP